jgi:hypothetical protein
MGTQRQTDARFLRINSEACSKINGATVAAAAAAAAAVSQFRHRMPCRLLNLAAEKCEATTMRFTADRRLRCSGRTKATPPPQQQQQRFIV